VESRINLGDTDKIILAKNEKLGILDGMQGVLCLGLWHQEATLIERGACTQEGDMISIFALLNHSPLQEVQERTRQRTFSDDGDVWWERFEFAAGCECLDHVDWNSFEEWFGCHLDEEPLSGLFLFMRDIDLLLALVPLGPVFVDGLDEVDESGDQSDHKNQSENSHQDRKECLSDGCGSVDEREWSHERVE